jgi:hypothetical protein
MRRSILSLLIFSAAGCGITGPDKVTLHLAGTVTAQATGQPVAGALIQLYAPCIIFGCNSDQDLARTTADAQGHYSLAQSVDNPCLGNGFGITLGVSGTGFAGTGQQVECKASLQTLDFSLATPTAASRAQP